MKARTCGCVIVLVALLLWGSSPTPAQAQSVWYVDWEAGGADNGTSWADAYTDLQSALEVASPGDEIWVAEGTYKPTLESSPGDTRSATFQLKNGVAVYGGFDPSVGDTAWEDRDWDANPTILSGDIGTSEVTDDNSYHVFYHPAGTDLDGSAVLDGFTITGGYANGAGSDNDGGGMYNFASSPTLSNCTFTGNSAADLGGGMLNTDSSSPALTNCDFVGNSASGRGGGMFNNVSSSPTLVNCTFSDNSTASDGGGMYNYGNANPTLINCTFSGNSAGSGGGMYNSASSPSLGGSTFSGNSASGRGGGMHNVSNSSPVLTDVTFSGNTAYDGGGMYNNGSSPTLTNCTFSGNSTSVSGGGMYSLASMPVLSNCTFSANVAQLDGGGMYNDGASPTLTNVTFTGNLAVFSGGGLFNGWSSMPQVTNCTFSGNEAQNGGGGMANALSSPMLANCILWGNTAPSGPQIYTSGGTPVIAHSDIQGSGGSGAGWDGGLGTDGGGNIDADPRFVDAANDDLRLRISSPAIDAGDNTAVPGGVTTDLAGNPRFVDVPTVADTGAGTSPLVDMGAYEYQYVPPPAVIYVDVDATGANDGTSWADAFTDLQDALTWAVGGVEIWVAEGTYLPTSGTDRSATFQLKNGVAVYGGFDPSVGATAWGDREWAIHETILSGDLNGDDGPDFVNNDENSYHVFYHPPGTNLDTTAVLDGFTVTGGNADGAGLHDRGSGMYNDGSSPTLANCTFEANSANLGGGIANSNSSPVVSNCTFSGNSADSDGGGMYNYDSSPTVTGCAFSGNTAESDGGAMYNFYGSSPTLANCTFSGNEAADLGGGMVNWSGSSPTLTDCTFSGNSADYGGAMVNSASSPVLINCSFEANSAVSFGGGMYSQADSSPALTNCTFAGNSANQGGGIVNSGGSPTLTNCTFSGNSATSYGGGTWNSGSSPMLTNCTFSGNSAAYGGGATFNSSSPSLTLVNSILWGDTPDEIYSTAPEDSPVVTYSDIQGGYGGTGNIDANPLFVDADGPDGSAGTLDDDLRLQSTSPAIDAGDSSAVPGGVTTDLAGNPRFVDAPTIPDTGAGPAPIVDMGAYETLPVIFVDAEATGANTGLSWDDAFSDLQDALGVAGFGQQIWVAEGTYRPSWQSDAGDPRSATFQMKNGVAIYGGFDPSVGDIGFADRDWAGNVTTLSGDLAGDDGPDFANNGENSYHVFYHPDGTGLDATAILDGFIVTGGNAHGSAWPHWDGGGMYNSGSSPVVTNCTFSGNSAGWGGGMYNLDSSPTVTGCTFAGNLGSAGGGGMLTGGSSAAPVIANCTFSGNHTDGSGGGMRNAVGGSSVVTNSTFSGNSASTGGGMYNESSSVEVTNCTFSGNSATSGGGMYNLTSSPSLTDATFSDNSALVEGGAMYNEGSSPTLTNCTFSENSAPYGGGMYSLDSSPALTGCAFSSNDADNDGGGMYNFASSPTLSNCTFTGNSAADLGGGMLNTDSSSPALTNCDFVGNSTSGRGGGMFNNVSSSPTLTDCTFSGNSTVSDGGGMYNYGNANPALINVTFSGNSATNSGGAMYNTEASNPTIQHAIFEENDAGQYGGGMCNLADSQPILEDVTFRNNTASWGGGLYAGDHSDLTLVDVLFELNIADIGGGMAADGSAPTLERVIFAENSAGDGGGMASVYNASPVVEDSTFGNNSADHGGAIYCAGDAAVTLSNSALTDNHANANGGGICNAILGSPTSVGTMWISGSSITGNSADQDGGGLYNSGIMTIDQSTIMGNAADADDNDVGNGGGIYNTSSYGLDVNDTVIGGNSAAAGGGIHNEDGDLKLANSTISGNSADQDGGGIRDLSSSWGIKLFNVTITGNTADADANDLGSGGGLVYDAGAVHLQNTIIAGNVDLSGTTRYADCMRTGAAGIPVTAYNLIGDETGCDGDFSGAGDLVGTALDPLDPRLGQLGDNGGSTLTHALLFDSPARDAGDPAGCLDPYGELLAVDQRGTERPRDGGAGEPLRCDIGAHEAGLPNDAWNRAQILDLSSGSASVEEYVDQLGQSRWYKFQVIPGSRLTGEMFPPDANLDIALFGDIQAAYDELQATADDGNLGESELVQLNAEFAADAYSPFAYSPFAYSPFAYSPFAYSPFAYSPFAYSPFAYSPFAYSPFAYSPFAYSPFAYSPFAYSPFAYSPFAYSPFAYSPFAYSPFAYSPDLAYSSAQMQTLMAISAFDGTASELIEVNTWDNRGWLYLRVSGRNGAFDPSGEFTLTVTQDAGVCAGVDLISRDSLPTAPNGNYQTLFLADWSRLDPTNLQAELEAFAEGVGGIVVDVSEDYYVGAANAEADEIPQCPYAKNQAAWLIKDIVTAYRDAGNPLEYVVLVGGDNVIPYFRYPDRAEIGSEKDYKPPVLEGTSSYASLTLGYVLSQDAYGSTLDLALSSGSMPIPDLAVGRLVEEPADILRMLAAYENHDGSLTPESALITGYDFLEDAALAIQSELEAGGVTADTLITPDAISPQDREGEPPLDAPWPAEMLRDQLLGTRHDLIFLAGHFTAQGALAADYETRLWASELLAPTVDLENALVYSAGCHSGYNVVNEHGVPYVTVEPDWAQAFAQAGATFIGGTGYQYGDTDFLEYSERLYLEFTQALRCGDQPRSVGQALVEAKQTYLAGTAQMRGIHEKAVLEATLFGLPMFQVDGLSNADCPVDPPSEVTSTEPYVSDPGEAPTPGQVLELQYAGVTVASNLSLETVSLSSVVDPAVYPDLAIDLDTTYFSGTDGTVTSPAEPVLPLERRNVDVPGYVLRGVGFRGGRYTDLLGEIPLTGAASTETRAAHTPFESDVLYPLQQWSVNYFDLLTDPAGGITWLDVTPAQFVSDADGNVWTGTWRRFDDMNFRLFYSANTDIYGGNFPALAAPPSILQVLATPGADQVHFQVRVAGDPTAGVQEVWVTYTGILCDDNSTCWQSLDLVQNADDSTLWEGALGLGGVQAAEIRYMVQAVNGVGLVSLITNEGEYFAVGVDPADPAVPAGGGEAPVPLVATSVQFETPPGSGVYSSEATFTAVLRTFDGIALGGQQLTFALGAQQRAAVTDGSGSATVVLPLHGAPGVYTVSATFAGGAGYQRSLATSDFTILEQQTLLTFLQDPGVAQYSDDALMVAELKDADDNALGEMTVLFLISGEGQTYTVSGSTDFLGRATASRVPLPVGEYSITARFGEAVEVMGESVDLTDPNYGGASASGTLVVWQEDATVTYTGDTTVPEGSTELLLEAVVTRADDGAPGDITLAWVQYMVYDTNDTLVAGPVTDQVSDDGTSTATVEVPAAGTYQVGVTVLGGYFASEPVPQVAGVTLPLEPVQIGTEVSGSAYFIDADSPFGHTAIWDWGDGSTCNTSIEGSPCAVTEPAGATPGEVTGSHTYTEPGVYTVVLDVTDDTDETTRAVYEFVVIYDLTGGEGFVTGGGWIWSEPGWCQLDELCADAAGQANFGFVSRYKKGADTPTGATEFNFSAGGLNFHSDSYEWLVVNQAGTNAQFKGKGTVNGATSPNGALYKFMIWAGDEDLDGGDTFRIKIWYEDDAGEEVTVYDNGFNQALGGGSIVIHKPD